MKNRLTVMIKKSNNGLPAGYIIAIKENNPSYYWTSWTEATFDEDGKIIIKPDNECYEEATKLITELEDTCPDRNMNICKFDPINREYHIHMQKINDAYWRRRMFTTEE